jgi:hypothetical protein
LFSFYLLISTTTVKKSCVLHAKKLHHSTRPKMRQFAAVTVIGRDKTGVVVRVTTFLSKQRASLKAPAEPVNRAGLARRFNPCGLQAIAMPPGCIPGWAGWHRNSTWKSKSGSPGRTAARVSPHGGHRRREIETDPVLVSDDRPDRARTKVGALRRPEVQECEDCGRHQALRLDTVGRRADHHARPD